MTNTNFPYVITTQQWIDCLTPKMWAEVPDEEEHGWVPFRLEEHDDAGRELVPLHLDHLNDDAERALLAKHATTVFPAHLPVYFEEDGENWMISVSPVGGEIVLRPVSLKPETQLHVLASLDLQPPKLLDWPAVEAMLNPMHNEGLRAEALEKLGFSWELLLKPDAPMNHLSVKGLLSDAASRSTVHLDI